MLLAAGTGDAARERVPSPKRTAVSEDLFLFGVDIGFRGFTSEGVTGCGLERRLVRRGNSKRRTQYFCGQHALQGLTVGFAGFTEAAPVDCRRGGGGHARPCPAKTST